MEKIIIKKIASLITIISILLTANIPVTAAVSGFIFNVRAPDYTIVTFTPMEMNYESIPNTTGFWYQGKMWMSIRAVFEAIGYEVTWDSAHRTVTAKNDEYVIKIPFESDTFTVNGEVFKFNPIVINASWDGNRPEKFYPVGMRDGMAVTDVRQILLRVGYTYEGYNADIPFGYPYSYYDGDLGCDVNNYEAYGSSEESDKVFYNSLYFYPKPAVNN